MVKLLGVRSRREKISNPDSVCLSLSLSFFPFFFFSLLFWQFPYNVGGIRHMKVIKSDVSLEVCLVHTLMLTVCTSSFLFL